MKRFALTILIGALCAMPALAQQDPAGGPPPDMQQQLQKAHDDARSAAIAALSPDHAAKVNDIITRVKGGQITDAHDAATQIDAILTPKEAQGVLAARDKMRAEMSAQGGPPAPGAMSGGPGGMSGGPGGMPGGGAYGAGGGPPREGGRMGMRGMRNDAGFVMLTLSLDRDQMRALFANARSPQ